MVTIASIVLIVFGALATLFGLLFILGGAIIGSTDFSSELGFDFNALPFAAGAFLAVIGAIIGGFGLLELLSGIFSLMGRGWARIVAIVMSILGALVFLPGVFATNAQGQGSPVVIIVIIAAYVFIIWAMVSGGHYFAGR